VTSYQSYRIWIARYRCPECRRTVAVLPSFLLPYFQYTLPTIWRVVKERLGLTPKRGMEEAPLLPTDEGVLFYVRRLFRNLNHLHCFFCGALEKNWSCHRPSERTSPMVDPDDGGDRPLFRHPRDMGAPIDASFCTYIQFLILLISPYMESFIDSTNLSSRRSGE